MVEVGRQTMLRGLDRGNSLCCSSQDPWPGALLLHAAACRMIFCMSGFMLRGSTVCFAVSLSLCNMRPVLHAAGGRASLWGSPPWRHAQPGAGRPEQKRHWRPAWRGRPVGYGRGPDRLRGWRGDHSRGHRQRQRWGRCAPGPAKVVQAYAVSGVLGSSLVPSRHCSHLSPAFRSSEPALPWPHWQLLYGRAAGELPVWLLSVLQGHVRCAQLLLEPARHCYDLRAAQCLLSSRIWLAIAAATDCGTHAELVLIASQSQPTSGEGPQLTACQCRDDAATQCGAAVFSSLWVDADLLPTHSLARSCPAADSEGVDEEAHAGLLADVRAELRGKGGKRKAHLISEAYPESEYNLQPAGGMTWAAAAFSAAGCCLTGDTVWMHAMGRCQTHVSLLRPLLPVQSQRMICGQVPSWLLQEQREAWVCCPMQRLHLQALTRMCRRAEELCSSGACLLLLKQTSVPLDACPLLL